MNSSTAADPLATEATSLLNRVHPHLVRPLPPISLTVAHLNTLETRLISSEDSCPHNLGSRPAETAFSLIVLLQLRVTRLRKPINSESIWERWSQERDNHGDAEVLEKHIESTWALFLQEYRSPQEIEDVLWLEFPAEQGRPQGLRVVDFIKRNDGPNALLSHRLIHLSLLRKWKYGGFINGPSEGSLSEELFRRYDNMCTPRVLHFLDLLPQLIFLALLAHFLLFPPIRPIILTKAFQYHGIRELFLLLLALSSITRPWSLLTVPSLLVFLAFLFRLPSVPFPGDASFTILHLALAADIFRFHLPVAPSPLFLLPFDLSLPISTLFAQNISRVICPAILFFLPVFLLVAFLLSFSLVDTFLRFNEVNVGFNSASIALSPMETRSAFLFIFTAVFLLFLMSLFVLAIRYSSSPQSLELKKDLWDRYTKSVGLSARRAFIRAVVSYARPYAFPPPFNLVQLLIHIPLVGMRTFGFPHAYLMDAERVLWRVLVAPIAIVITAILWASMQ